jgi:uncharacterized membrane protein
MEGYKQSNQIKKEVPTGIKTLSIVWGIIGLILIIYSTGVFFGAKSDESYILGIPLFLLLFFVVIGIDLIINSILILLGMGSKLKMMVYSLVFFIFYALAIVAILFVIPQAKTTLTDIFTMIMIFAITSITFIYLKFNKKAKEYFNK